MWLESSLSKSLFRKCRKLSAMSFPMQVGKRYMDGKKITHESASSDKRTQTYDWFFSKKHLNSDALVPNLIPHSGEMSHADHTLGWQGVCNISPTSVHNFYCNLFCWNILERRGQMPSLHILELCSIVFEQLFISA